LELINSSTASLENKTIEFIRLKNMRHSFLAVLASLAVLITSNHLCFAQTNPANPSQSKQVQGARSEKLKKRVEKIGIGGKITAVRLDGRDFYGSVSSIELEGFQMVEVDSRQTVSFKYAELEKIHKGDGERNLITGKRANPRRGWLYVAAIAGTLTVLLAIRLSDKDF